MRRVQLVWVITVALWVSADGPASNRPNLLPTRDVDLSYRVTGSSDKPVTQRVRWLAADHLQRIDGPGGVVILADRTTTYITILNQKNRSYVKIEEPAEGLFRIDPSISLTRGSSGSVLALSCTEWTWNNTATNKARTVCLTDDGVVLRMTEDDNVLLEALSIAYRHVDPATFRIPSNYEPTLIPDSSSD